MTSQCVEGQLYRLDCPDVLCTAFIDLCLSIVRIIHLFSEEICVL